MKTEENFIRYKGKGEHSVNELEKIIEQREEELHFIRSKSQQPMPTQNEVINHMKEVAGWEAGSYESNMVVDFYNWLRSQITQSKQVEKK